MYDRKTNEEIRGHGTHRSGCHLSACFRNAFLTSESVSFASSWMCASPVFVGVCVYVCMCVRTDERIALPDRHAQLYRGIHTFNIHDDAPRTFLECRSLRESSETVGGGGNCRSGGGVWEDCVCAYECMVNGVNCDFWHRAPGHAWAHVSGSIPPANPITNQIATTHPASIEVFGAEPACAVLRVCIDIAV